MTWIDRHGWPLTYFKNRPVLNALRWLLHVSLWKTFKTSRCWVRDGSGGLQYISPGLPSPDTPICDCFVSGKQETA